MGMDPAEYVKTAIVLASGVKGHIEYLGGYANPKDLGLARYDAAMAYIFRVMRTDHDLLRRGNANIYHIAAATNARFATSMAVFCAALQVAMSLYVVLFIMSKFDDDAGEPFTVFNKFLFLSALVSGFSALFTKSPMEKWLNTNGSGF